MPHPTSCSFLRQEVRNKALWRWTCCGAGALRPVGLLRIAGLRALPVCNPRGNRHAAGSHGCCTGLRLRQSVLEEEPAAEQRRVEDGRGSGGSGEGEGGSHGTSHTRHCYEINLTVPWCNALALACPSTRAVRKHPGRPRRQDAERAGGGPERRQPSAHAAAHRGGGAASRLRSVLPFLRTVRRACHALRLRLRQPDPLQDHVRFSHIT
jgi:hypothetical protein